MEERRKRTILIIAGEASSDLYAAELIRRLKEKDPNLRILAFAGEAARAAGAELQENLVRHAVIGFAGVLKNLSYFRRQLKRVRELLASGQIDAVIPIDYPGFNIRVCRMAHERGIKVIYYISPQVWAWGKNREQKLARWVNTMLVTFPFEEEIYRRAECDAVYVGNPLLDVMERREGPPREELIEKHSVDPDEEVIGLFPGSRAKEVEHLLPVMLEAALLLKRTRPKVRFYVSRASTIASGTITPFLKGKEDLAGIWDQTADDLFCLSDAVMIKSGTGSLQAALHQTPMVVLYKLASWEYFLGRLLVNVEHIAMPNILAGERIVPELIQHEASPERIAGEIQHLLGGEGARTRERLGVVRERLGGPGASERAAEEILKVLAGMERNI